MTIIAESMEHVQSSVFFNAINTNKYRDLFVQFSQLQSLCQATDPNLDSIGVTWRKLEDNIENLLEDLDSFQRSIPL